MSVTALSKMPQDKLYDEDISSANVASKKSNPIDEEQRLYAYWNFYITQGYRKHKEGCVKGAITAFQEGIRIGHLLLKLSHQNAQQFSAIDLLHTAAHNLAACYNQMGCASRGESLLHSIYQLVTEECDNPVTSKANRLEALTVLDKSLFSLISQRAYMGKVSNVHQLIKDTETLAERVSESLNKQ
jgi:hypothetical protein